MPVVRMFVTKWHVRKRFSFVRKKRFSLDRPFLTAVFFALHKSLPDKVTRCQTNRQCNIFKKEAAVKASVPVVDAPTIPIF